MLGVDINSPPILEKNLEKLSLQSNKIASPLYNKFDDQVSQPYSYIVVGLIDNKTEQKYKIEIFLDKKDTSNGLFLTIFVGFLLLFLSSLGLLYILYCCYKRFVRGKGLGITSKNIDKYFLRIDKSSSSEAKDTENQECSVCKKLLGPGDVYYKIPQTGAQLHKLCAVSYFKTSNVKIKKIIYRNALKQMRFWS